LDDRPRSGRPCTVEHDRIITATLTPPPKRLGVTHWSSRLLATKLKIDHATVAPAWKDYGVQPWRSQTFKFSTDPELVAQVIDVGLYLAPPEDAIVLSIDEKSQIQALDRIAPILPIRPGLPDGPHTTSGTEPATCSPPWRSRPGRSTAACRPRHRHRHRHRHQEFLRFLKQVAPPAQPRATPVHGPPTPLTSDPR